MSYLEPYESLDWLSVSSQSSTGLNAQLPGSENLLPEQNGYQVDTTANLPKEIKHHSTVDDYWDIPEEDDWICFGSIGLPASGGLDDSYVGLGDFLPESPEITSFDLTSFSQSQSLNHEAHSRKSLDGDALKSKNLSDVVVLGSDLDFDVKLDDGHQTGDVPEDILDSGRLYDFDPDPSWLLLPVPILPSLEEVESVLSASPLSAVSDEETLLPTGFETHSSGFCFDSLPVPLQFSGSPLENMLLSGSPLDIFLANIGDDGSKETASSSVQASPNITWAGDDESERALGLSGGFFDFDGTSAVGTSSDSLLSSEAGDASLLSDVEEISSSGSSCPIRSSPVSARAGPYPTSGGRPERRVRKREQNKTAALKYRQKKREEQGVFVSECEQLEKRNSDLKSRVGELTREISYLKGLISEIYSSQAE